MYLDWEYDKDEKTWTASGGGQFEDSCDYEIKKVNGKYVLYIDGDIEDTYESLSSAKHSAYCNESVLSG